MKAEAKVRGNMLLAKANSGLSSLRHVHAHHAAVRNGQSDGAMVELATLFKPWGVLPIRITANTTRKRDRPPKTQISKKSLKRVKRVQKVSKKGFVPGGGFRKHLEFWFRHGSVFGGLPAGPILILDKFTNGPEVLGS
eukprot:4086395-Amphidinium_carterae.1